ncbi:unnamed protein product [Euphydryas editha]|uniref:B box-type domain-containing protein n=1 Tax=Euphydryas editha TaxID=104508 RepID=A0AAU9VCH0_EUPED|nr:unnamed protein product [Euphydryas editha]
MSAKGKNRSPTSMEKCSKCNKAGNPADKKLSITCDCCKDLLCGDCHGLSPTEIRVFELKTVARVVTFLCADCRSTMTPLPSILKKLNDLTDEVQQLRLRQNMMATEAAVHELTERKYRAQNIIVYDIPESTSENIQEKKKHDSEEVAKLIRGVCNIDCSKAKMFRLGAPKSADAPPRPLKVILKSKSEALAVLRNKGKLSKPGSIKADLTPLQREYLKYLREELDKRISSGEKDVTIKYIQGQPKIVKNKILSNSQKNC